MATVQQEGKRTVARDVKHYNIEAIISVGYRVNSRRATQLSRVVYSEVRRHSQRTNTWIACSTWYLKVVLSAYEQEAPKNSGSHLLSAVKCKRSVA